MKELKYTVIIVAIAITGCYQSGTTAGSDQAKIKKQVQTKVDSLVRELAANCDKQIASKVKSNANAKAQAAAAAATEATRATLKTEQPKQTTQNKIKQASGKVVKPGNVIKKDPLKNPNFDKAKAKAKNLKLGKGKKKVK